MDQINQPETERVFTPSGWRMVLITDGMIIVSFLLFFLLSAIFSALTGNSRIIGVAETSIGSLIAVLLLYTAVYGLNREIYSIKIDSVSITRPYAYGSKRVLLNEIDPLRSKHRKSFFGLFNGWDIHDVNGNVISLTEQQFRPEIIVEILAMLGLDKVNTLDQTEERVITPSPWRKIFMRTAFFGIILLLILGFNLISAGLQGNPIKITRLIEPFIYFLFNWLYLYTFLYFMNRDIYPIRIDAASITGPSGLSPKLICRNEIDPVRSRQRNIFDKLINGWHIRDARGKGLFISMLDFRADEIIEILKIIGLGDRAIKFNQPAKDDKSRAQNMEQINQPETDRVFTPSAWRLIWTHTLVSVIYSAAFILPGPLLDFLRGEPRDFLTISEIFFGLCMALQFFCVLIYGLNRDLYQIRVDDVSVTGRGKYGTQRILLSEIDHIRSRRRNGFEKILNQWILRDNKGVWISFSGLDFKADEIAAILKTIGLEMM